MFPSRLTLILGSILCSFGCVTSQIPVPFLTTSPPSASFTTNLTSNTKVGVPFTLSCTVSLPNGTLEGSYNYSVGFFSKRARLLGTFEHRNGEQIVLIEKHEHMSIQPGDRAVYPSFELILVEMKGFSSEYWCTLNEGPEGNQTHESTHWKTGPTVQFTSRNANGTNSQLGTCLLNHFDPTPSQEYSVAFDTDLGAKLVNQLAVYLIKPNRMLEFDTQAVPGWKEIVHVPHSGHLTFAIQATGSAPLNGTWWCVLGVGAQGSSEYREVKSGVLQLAVN